MLMWLHYQPVFSNETATEIINAFINTDFEGKTPKKVDKINHVHVILYFIIICFRFTILKPILIY